MIEEGQRNHGDAWNDVNAGINANTRTRSPTWLLKMDWNLAQDHLLELTSFSDVARTTQVVHTNDEGVLNRTGVLGTVYTEQGGTSHALKYTGYLSDSFTLSALFGRGKFSRSIYGISANGTRQEWSGDINAPDTGCPVIVDQRNSTLLGATPSIRGCDFIGGTLGRPDAGDTRRQFRVDVDWQLGDHQLRFGYDADRFTSVAGGAIEGGQVWNYATIDPDGVPLNDDDLDFVVNVVFKNGATVDVDQRAFYIEDRWQVTPNFLAYAGLRWDSFDNRNGNGESYASIDNQLGPRLGFAWDVKGDASLKVFGNAGRYALPLTATVAIRGASASIFSQQLFFYDSVDPATGAPVGATPFTPITYLNNEFGAQKDPRTIASENLQPMYQDEFILGFQKQVDDHWSFGVRTVFRDLRRAIDDNCDERAIYDWAIANGFVDPDGDPFQSPADSTVPKEIAFINPGFTFCHLYNPGSDGVFNIDIDGNGTLEKVTIDADTLGPKAKRTYAAAEFFFEGHWDKLFLQGSYTWARSTGNTEGGIKSDIGQADTGTTQDFDYRELMLGADGPLPNDRKHTLKVFGNYELNDQWSIGGNLLVQSGRPINCFGVYSAERDLSHYGNGPLLVRPSTKDPLSGNPRNGVPYTPVPGYTPTPGDGGDTDNGSHHHAVAAPYGRTCRGRQNLDLNVAYKPNVGGRPAVQGGRVQRAEQPTRRSPWSSRASRPRVRPSPPSTRSRPTGRPRGRCASWCNTTSDPRSRCNCDAPGRQPGRCVLIAEVGCTRGLGDHGARVAVRVARLCLPPTAMETAVPISFAKPVVILSAPRSGSTLLFETLARAPGLHTIGGESHRAIEGIPSLHPASRGFASNRLEASDAPPEVAEALRQRFVAGLRDRDGAPVPDGGSVRLLEKTPKNVLRIPFMRQVFPDARFVVLWRDPRAVLSSMIEAWRSGHFVTYPGLPGWDAAAVVVAPRARLAAGERASTGGDRGLPMGTRDARHAG
jgi:hypothetical protein